MFVLLVKHVKDNFAFTGHVFWVQSTCYRFKSGLKVQETGGLEDIINTIMKAVLTYVKWMQTPIELNEGVSDIRVKGRAKTLERQRREWGETGRQKRAESGWEVVGSLIESSLHTCCCHDNQCRPASQTGTKQKNSPVSSFVHIHILIQQLALRTHSFHVNVLNW